MLAGKWISKMFDTNDKQMILNDSNRYNYEFTCDMNYKQFINIIDNYFRNLSKNAKFIEYDLGKVN
jgi:hypothetical protein